MISSTNLWQQLRETLHNAGSDGGVVTPSVYDSAIVLWLSPLAEDERWGGLNWLFAQLQSDGGWGNQTMPLARDAVTLASILAMKTAGHRTRHLGILDSATSFLRRSSAQWRPPLPDNLPGGVEVILPRLVDEARRIGIPISPEPYHALEGIRQCRLQIISKYPLHRLRGTTAAHVFEGWGTVADPELQDSMGSIGHSPAATAYWIHLAQGQPHLETAVARARDYLQAANRATSVAIPGIVPTSWPLGYFEVIFGLHALQVAGLLGCSEIKGEIRAQSAVLASAFSEAGIGFTNAFCPDGDDTAVATGVLREAGHAVSFDALGSFGRGDHFCAWTSELQSAVTVTAHALYALGRENMLSPEDMQPYIEYLRARQLPSGLWMGDKWNNSALYVTSQILIAWVACGHHRPIGYIIDGLLAYQHSNGGWGTGTTATIEETAYVVLALLQARRAGLLSPAAKAALQQAGRCLFDNDWHLQEDVPLCWLGKELYGVKRISQMVVLAAMLAIIKEGIL